MKSDGRNDVLKIIAILTMLIDHIGVLLLPELSILRTIGRISFPIFCYFIANGYRYTSNRKKYFTRILIFALISQIPYMFLNYGAEMELMHFNVLFLFAYALIVLHFVDRLRAHTIMRYVVTFILTIIPLILQILIPNFALSYGTYGIILVLIFYVFKDNFKKIFVSFVILSLLYPYISVSIYMAQRANSIATVLDFRNNYDILMKNSNLFALSGFYFQARSILAILVIDIFRKVDINFRINKYFFYIFYPAHISILLLIRYLMGM